MVNLMEIKNSDLADAINTIAELARKAQKSEPVTVGERSYLFGCDRSGEPYYCEIKKSDDTYYPECMNVKTLDAFVNYILAGIKNGEIKDKLYINIVSPTCVVAETPVNDYGKRKLIVKAERYNLRNFAFGQYTSFENFVVSLQSQFLPTEERNNLLSSLKLMTQSNEVHTEDNGVSQSVVAKAGATLGAVQVSPIWELKPFRTFTEIDQPRSLFLLRLTQTGDSASFALHETDGGAWAISAMQVIKEYLTGNLLEQVNAGKVFVL